MGTYLRIRVGKWPLATSYAETEVFGIPWGKINFDVPFEPLPPFSPEIWKK